MVSYAAPTRPGYEVAVGFLSVLVLPLINICYMCFMLLYTPRERELINALLRRVRLPKSCECWRDIEYFWEGTVFASEYCPPIIKLSRLISWKAFRAFYDGGHYSLRGDIIHLVNNVRGDNIH